MSLEDELFLYLKLCNCFYTVILTETAEDLQNALSECYSYGEQYKLNIDINKTKVLVFYKRPVKKRIFF